MADTMKQINNVNHLVSCVGNTPGPRDLKVIDFLDAEALRWISVSPFLAISRAAVENQVVQVLMAGGEPGFIKADAHTMTIPRDSLDNAGTLNEGDGFGSLFLIPTQKESLRVNGMVRGVTESSIEVEVTECYLHCAKAFMRSRLWEDYATPPVVDSPSEFCQRARFMFVATSDDQRRADLSPKGDPAGKLLRLDGNTVWYPDRPGNRRVDGFRNILSQPKIEIMALLAGSSQVLRISGQAVLYAEHPSKIFFEFEGKTPSVVARVEPERITLEMNTALERARLWPPRNPGQQFKAAEIWQAHMKLSKLTGIEATLTKTAISVPGVLDQALNWDYKNNLY